MRRFAVPLVLGALAITAVSSRAEAQSIFFGGGVSKPLGEFNDYAKTGWLLQGGINFDIGSSGIFAEAEGFFGSNSHKNTGNFKEKTNIIAFMGALGKSFGATDAKMNPYSLAGAGILGHQFRSDNDSAVEETENKFVFTGAAGISLRLNEKAKFWIEARYLGASGTSVLPVMAGVLISLGGGGS